MDKLEKYFHFNLFPCTKHGLRLKKLEIYVYHNVDHNVHLHLSHTRQVLLQEGELGRVGGEREIKRRISSSS